MVALALFAGVMGFVLVGFLLYHMYLIFVGKTTNEAFKWNDLKKVYNKLVSAHIKYMHKNIGRPKALPKDVATLPNEKNTDDSMGKQVKGADEKEVSGVDVSPQRMKTRRTAAAAAALDTATAAVAVTDPANDKHSSSSSSSGSSRRKPKTTKDEGAALRDNSTDPAVRAGEVAQSEYQRNVATTSSSSSTVAAVGEGVEIDDDDDDEADVGCIPFPSMKKQEDSQHTLRRVLDHLDGFPGNNTHTLSTH